MAQADKLLGHIEGQELILPQGGGLSPLLFAVYTSDMTEACPTASMTLYADDTTGSVAANTSEDVFLQMEKVAEEVLSYMADNKLAPNKKKTQFIVFTSKRMRRIQVGDCSIQEDKCVTFLGAVINKKMVWTDQVDQLEKDLCKLKMESFID
jgi:hypothetical protein